MTRAADGDQRILGIMSDSHGRPLAVRRALEVFDRHGVSAIVHCGDVGGTDVFDEVVGRDFRFVWGNCDVPTAGLLAYLETVHVTPPSVPPMRFEFGDKRFAVFHGHEPGAGRAESLVGIDYLLHGHTHEKRDERVGSVRVINPGALHRAAVKTVATLDVVADALRFHPIA